MKTSLHGRITIESGKCGGWPRICGTQTRYRPARRVKFWINA